MKADVYMQEAAGFKAPGKERVVCKPEKSIYGLKQTAHARKSKKGNQCYLKSDSHKAKLMPDARTRDGLRS